MYVCMHLFQIVPARREAKLHLTYVHQLIYQATSNAAMQQRSPHGSSGGVGQGGCFLASRRPPCFWAPVPGCGPKVRLLADAAAAAIVNKQPISLSTASPKRARNSQSSSPLSFPPRLGVTGAVVGPQAPATLSRRWSSEWVAV